MGTPDFAVPALEKLIAWHEVLAVVTQPDRPKGRGNRLTPPPVKETALLHGISVLQPEKVRGNAGFTAELRAYNADVFIVAAYGQILPAEILGMPKYGCVNIHASLLPKYRGAAPIQYAIINGETVTGITIMQMDKGIDTGDILLQKAIEIEPGDTGGSLFGKLAILGGEGIAEALPLIEKGLITPIKQDNDKASHAPMLTKQSGEIDWNRTSAEVANLVRAMEPSPSAYGVLDGEVLKVRGAKPFFNREIHEKDEKSKAGTVVGVIKNGIIVKTGDGAVLVTEVQARGGKRMDCADYLRGHDVYAGMRFV